MSHVRLLLYRGRELDIVSQAESVEPLSPMLSSLDRASQGMAAIEAVDQLALEREPNPRLYTMLGRCPAHDRRASVAAERAGVLLEAAGGRGPRPQLDACVRCGESSPTCSSSPSTSTRAGCCAGLPQSGTSISRRRPWRLMRDILGGRLNEALALRGVAGHP